MYAISRDNVMGVEPCVLRGVCAISAGVRDRSVMRPMKRDFWAVLVSFGVAEGTSSWTMYGMRYTFSAESFEITGRMFLSTASVCSRAFAGPPRLFSRSVCWTWGKWKCHGRILLPECALLVAAEFVNPFEFLAATFCSMNESEFKTRRENGGFHGV